VGADYTAPSNADVREDYGTKTEKGSVSDFNEGVVILELATYLDIAWDVVERVSRVDDGTVRGNRHVVADRDTMMTNYMYILFYSGVIADA
jgi:hypothetical protein